MHAPHSPRSERLKRFWREYRWPILGVVEGSLLLLGYVGFRRYAAALGQSPSPLDLLYVTVQLVTLESGAVSGPLPWELELARLLLPLVSAYTALAAFASLFRRQIESVRLWFIRRHVIVCGLGAKGSALIARFLERGDSVVVVEQDPAHEALDACRHMGAIVLTGDARSVDVLRRAGAHRARYLIAVCGDDGVNAEVAVRARELSAVRPSHTLTCAIHIVDPRLWMLLRECEITVEQHSLVRLELFSIFDHGARSLLQAYPPAGRTSLREGDAPHIVVVGLGHLGKSLIVAAAREWWDRGAGAGPRIRISAVECDAVRECLSLQASYPRLAQACDLVPYPIDTRAPEFQQAAFLHDASGADACPVTTVYVCLDDESQALQAALTLLQQTRPFRIPIVIRVAADAGLAALLAQSRVRQGAFSDLHTFALIEHTCTTEMVLDGTHELLARAIHREYVRSQEAAGQTPLTNPAMRPWEQLPEQLRESNRRQADQIGVRLDAVGYTTVPLTDWEAGAFQFTPEQIEVMAEMEHARWVDDLRRDGWRHAPGARDPVRRTHPALLPWAELPEEEREKNRVIVHELPALLARAGFQIHPRQ